MDSEEMVALFTSSTANVHQSNLNPYPMVYLYKGAPTIEDFCNIVVEEARAEGVKPDVVFSQIMLETGWLQFGGIVSATQCNFGGLGATGPSNPGLSFSSVREGVRAQVQHLKAYASYEGLNNDVVDPRFVYVRRCSAPYVEWLGIHENPFGLGWASAKGYGASILRIAASLSIYT